LKSADLRKQRRGIKARGRVRIRQARLRTQIRTGRKGGTAAATGAFDPVRHDAAI
jgi:hypothetical protein